MYRGIDQMIEQNLTFKNKGFFSKKIIEYLEKNSSHVSLLRGIKNGVAYHNGSVDKYVRTLLEWAFKNGEIKVLFANNTITKGVNLNPNLIIVENYSWIINTEESIKKIEILNAFGRAGRTILKRDVIGEIVIILKSSSRNKRKDDVIKKNEQDPINEIKIPPLKPIENPRDFRDAYLRTWNNNYQFPNISKEGEVLIKNHLSKNYSEINKKEVNEKLFEYIEKFYEIKWKTSQSRVYMLNLIQSYLFQIGYSKLLENKRNEAIKNQKYINSSGWTILPSRYNDSDDKVKSKYKKFKPETSHEDLLLSNCIYDYENIAGFYFSQLLNYLIENGKKQEIFDKKLIRKYFDNINDEQNLTTKHGWPNSFGRIFIEQQKNKIFRKKLNHIVKKASEIE